MIVIPFFIRLRRNNIFVHCHLVLHLEVDDSVYYSGSSNLLVYYFTETDGKKRIKMADLTSVKS